MMINTVETELSLGDVFGELRAIVDVLASRGARGATREDVEASCEDFQLHTMAYVRFLENQGCVTVLRETGNLVLGVRPDVRNPGPLTEPLRNAFRDNLMAADKAVSAVVQSTPPTSVSRADDRGLAAAGADLDSLAAETDPVGRVQLAIGSSAASGQSAETIPRSLLDPGAPSPPKIAIGPLGQDSTRETMPPHSLSDVPEVLDSVDIIDMSEEDCVPDEGGLLGPVLDPPTRKDFVALEASSIEWSEAADVDLDELIADPAEEQKPLEIHVADAAPSDAIVVADEQSPTALAIEAVPEMTQPSVQQQGVQPNMNVRPPTFDAAENPRYEKLEPLGSGATSTVYRARQIQLNRIVALRELREVFDVFATVNRADIVARFQNIAETQAALSQPNILPILDLDTYAEFPYIVTAFAPNGNLRRVTGVEGRPRLKTSLKYFLQILHSIRFAHDADVLHGSLKPENVLLDPTGNAQVTDFGMSRVAELDASRANQVFVGMGAVAYMSPEQFRQPNLSTVKSDIYALGIMFYELLVGKVPGRRSPMPSSFFPDIPRAIDDIFDRMCYDDEEGRYGHVSEIFDDIYKSKEIMSLLDRRTGLLFVSDPLKQRDADDALGDAIEDHDDEDSVQIVAPDPPVSIHTEADEEPEGQEESEAHAEGDREEDVLAKLSKYGEVFDESP
jgi:eukaryotic-like serine/threonine-protein kinase